MIVYCTTNLINGKKYIGLDSNNNPKYLGSGNNISKAIKKYGCGNFKKQILEYCDSLENLVEAEKYWIDYFGAVKSDWFYNIMAGGCYNIPNPDYVKDISKPILCYNLDGVFLKKYDSRQDAARDLNIDHSGIVSCANGKIERFKNYIFKPFTDDFSLKIEPYKLSLVGKKRDSETIDKIKKANTGQKRTKEVCDKFREIRLSLNFKQSEETKQKMSVAHKGKIRTEQHKINNGKANRFPVLQFDLNGNFIAEFDSLLSTSKYLSIDLSWVCECLKQDKPCKGFILKYKNKSRKIKQ